MIYLGIVAIILIALFVAVYVSEEKSRKAFIASLNESAEYDIIELWKYRAVQPRATGQDITRINAEIKNRTDKSLHVLIMPGTYFCSSGEHQNMVVRENYHFNLSPLATRSIQVPATCINASRPIPGKENTFEGVEMVSDDIQRFLKAARYEDEMVVQAGVWALTDKMNGFQIRNHLFRQGRNGDRQSVISESHVARAKAILSELGITNSL